MEKEFTENDIKDAFQAGINFARRRIERNIKNTIMAYKDEDYDTNHLDAQMEYETVVNILKDKRGIPRI